MAEHQVFGAIGRAVPPPDGRLKRHRSEELNDAIPIRADDLFVWAQREAPIEV